MKERFYFYMSFRRPLQKLTAEEKGNLLDAIFQYQIDGTHKELSPAAEMAFDFISETLDKDNEIYLETCEKNKANGKLGGRPKKANKPSGYSDNQAVISETEGFFQKPKKADMILSKDNNLYTETKKVSGDIDKNINNKENTACLEIVELIAAFCKNHNRTYSGSKDKAAKIIKCMFTVDGLELAEVKAAFMQYMQLYTGSKYDPEIFSARALREKYNSLQGFIRRHDSQSRKNYDNPTGVVL